MYHTMIVAAPVRTATSRWPAVAVKSDVKTGHDIAYVTRGHASGCTGAMAYYTRTGEPLGTWEGRGCAALGVSGTVQAAVAERLYQEGVGPGGERIIHHAAPKSDEDQAAAEAAAITRHKEKHPFASASEINAERTGIRATSPGISRPYYDVASSASKSVSVLHASLGVAAAQASLNLASNITSPSTPPVWTRPLTLRSAVGLPRACGAAGTADRAGSFAAQTGAARSRLRRASASRSRPARLSGAAGVACDRLGRI
jgi:TrwC relaxase